MNEPPSTPATDAASPPRKRFGLWSIGNWIGSLATSLLLVWICWSTLRNWQSLVANPQRLDPTSVPNSADLELRHLTPLLPKSDLARSGGWGVEGWNGRLIIEQVDESEMDLTIQRILETSEPGTALPPAEFSEWMASARSILSQPRVVGTKRIYSLDDQQSRVRLATEIVGEEERFCAAVAATRVSANRWTLFAIQDLEEATSKPARTGMLPLAPGATIKMSRLDEAGMPIFQLIQTPHFHRTTVESWINDGWSITDQEASKKSSYTAICRKNGVEIAVWTTGILDRPGLMILTRLSASAP